MGLENPSLWQKLNSFTALMLERKINLQELQDHKIVSVMSH